MATADQNVRRTQALDELIMATNSSSIASKRSVERIYYPDEPHYFRFFVKKFQRRAPLINRGYHLRLKVIDTLVRRFLEKPSSLKKVVVNLGCGSDVLPWQCEVRYPEACHDVTFVDVDYPDLIEKKRRIVLETPELQDIMGTWEVSDTSPVVLQSQKYCQVGCDLRRLSTLENSLSSLFDLSKTEFLFVAEVSITYMDTEGADGVIQWAGTLENAEFCLLEQILPDGPDHPFAHTMLKHFNKLNTPIKSVHRYSTVASQENRFATLGWPKVESWTLWEAWADDLFMTSTERKALDAVEPFDEWEEFALFASHYVVILGSTPGGQEHAHLSLRSGDSGIKSYQVPMSFSAYESSRGHRRFGAAMLVDKPDGQTIVSHVLGQGSNGRLNSEDWYQISYHRPPASASHHGPSGRVCHTLTDLGNAGVLFVGGRTSPSTAFQDCWLRRKVFNTWERVQDLPLSLYRHSVTRLATSSLALLFGGRSNHLQTSASCLLFDPSRGWTPCNTQPTPPALCGAILTCTGSNGFGKYEGILAGGLLADGLVNQNTYFWSLDTSDPEPLITFENIDARINECTANLLSRFGSTATLVKGNILIFGGVVKDVQLPAADDILVLKVAHRSVEIVAKVDGVSDAGTLRPFLIGSSVVSYGDGSFAIVGGGATCFSMGTCWAPGSYSFAFEADRLWEHNKSSPSPNALPPVKYLETVEITRADAKQSTEMPAPATPQPIPRKKIETKEQFQAILDEGKPVVIVGSDIGCCKSTWSPEYLVDSVGPQREVSVHESTTEKMDFNAKNFRYVTKKFADFIDEARNGKRLYMRALSNEAPSSRPTQLSDDYPSLAKDFILPPQLAFVNDNTFSSVLRISGPVNMWLHYDVMANVYVQVMGSKRLILFPPSDVSRFSFAPGASSSSVDVFSSLESDSLRGVHPHEALLTPGDILFLPPLWLHTATPSSSKLSVAVNIFFRNLQRGYSVGRDVYGNRDLAAYERGRQDIARLSSGFSKLPPDARGFYLQRLADELLQSITD